MGNKVAKMKYRKMIVSQKPFEKIQPMSGVILSSRAAGVVTKTAPTSTKSTIDPIRITIRIVPPNSLPMISGKETPPSRIHIMPQR